ncbi:beta-L-arabinofuranosidase domain-containing protein [Edaphobacter sp.]|uniref:beta-L-arabinofuranosidase domain-containing protein n=1 Tax=Edaphobacter sp. TaxID=1934404 RepID=UPI002DB91119|nr:beta-L-arabinofuranosidase domain-containing protein [Edaphobacter sp.]HEU5340443.1 beta-L-arabinofuranosidase domain-containing protein [Edaphobacter sp.]
MKLTRRTFLKSIGAAAALPAPAIAAASAREPFREFPYSAVQLTSGPLKRHYEAIHAHYLSLDNDRLLKVYRQRAGLPAPGRDMGGWYDLNGFVPGHSLGQYISGLARFGASSGDEACHEKVHVLVEGFAATLGPDNQSILRPETNLWPCYILDKHFAGLINAATLSNVANARDLLTRVLDGAKTLLPAKGRDRIGKKNPPYDETYVMPENLFTAHALTGNPVFHELAVRYLLDREFFDPLARGGNPFPGQHAYSHAIALSSGAKAYLTLGDSKYHDVIQNAFTLLTTQQQFASGGWGPNETFITPHKGELYAALQTTEDHFETPCGSYAATKLARYLIRTASDPRHLVPYGDNLERVLYNTILAAKMPDSDGDYFYYSTYSPNAIKVYYPKKWPCCSGTLAQTVADYPLNLYFLSPTGIHINTYTSSQVTWKQGSTPVKLTQTTNYPTENTVAITLHLGAPTTFTITLRVPSWTPSAASIKINDAPTIKAAPGTLATLRALWRSGDRIIITIPQDFRIELIDELHPETVALMRGPVQYAALNPPTNLVKARLPLPSSLKQIAPETFVEDYEGRRLIFVPFYRIQNETYTAYFTRA